MSRKAFLDNLRLARNLSEHAHVTTDSRHLDPTALAQALTRAAIWLTPAAMKGFKADDFAELGPANQQALAEAVQEFERIAAQVPPDSSATDQQLSDAEAALGKILTILGSYLPSHEDATQVRSALECVDFPQWILNWDYEVGDDEDGGPGVWFTFYADENAIPQDQYGRRAVEMLPKLRSALKAAGIRRWPYIRMRTAREHKAG